MTGHDSAVASPGASPLERSVREHLRLYPLSWREEHGEDLVATSLDVLVADRLSPEDSVPFRVTLGFNRAGYAQRHRSAHRRRAPLQRRADAAAAPRGHAREAAGAARLQLVRPPAAASATIP